MKQTVNERIFELIDNKRLTPLEFSLKIGYISTSELSRIKNGKEVTERVIRRILKAFPEINKSWLVNGIPPIENKKVDIPPARPLGDVKHDPHGKQIPVLDLDIYATITPSLSDVVALKPAAFISIPMFSQGEYAVQVTGHSMKGYINHGDWIIIKRITNRASLIYGEPHLIVTKADNIKTVKFIKMADDDDHLTLVPYNIEQFDPQDIRKDDVQEIWRVIGLFRTV